MAETKIILYIIYFMRVFYVNIAEHSIISYLLVCSHSDNLHHSGTMCPNIMLLLYFYSLSYSVGILKTEEKKTL